MNEMEDFDEIVKKKLSHARVQLPEDDWDILEHDYASFKKRRRLLLAGVSFLSIASAIAVFSIFSRPDERLLQPQKAPAVAIMSTDSDSYADDTKPSDLPVAELARHSEDAQQHSVPSAVPDEIGSADISTHAEENEVESSRSIEDDVDGQMSTCIPEPRRRRIHAGVSFSGGIISAMRVSEESQSGSIILEPGKTVKTEAHHQRPLRLNILLGIPLSDRLSLETGLSFCRLNSVIRTEADMSSYSVDQSLNFIGIPAGVSYSLWDNDKFSLYVSGGFLAERMIDGTSVRRDSDIRSELTVKGLQCSVYGVAGIGARIAPRFGIALEPGISYYFPASGNSIQTIYSEHPLDMEIRLSLKFDL